MDHPRSTSWSTARWLLALALPLVACDDGGSGGNLLDAANAAVGSAKACKPGSTEACFCPDGTQSGQQACGAQGQRMPCECGGMMASEQPVVTTPSQLCPEISGSSDCHAESYGSSKVPVSLLFTVDRSRSMVCNPPPVQTTEECAAQATAKDDMAPSKWDITTQALSDAFAALPSGGAMAGLSFFSVNGACGVDSTPAVALAPIESSQLDAMGAALEATQPRGETPLVGATILAYAHLHQEAMAPGNRFVVLITDGEESCAADSIGQLLDTEVEKAREANIRTFVIGAPGSESARAFLSELAFRGGTARTPDCKHGLDGDPTVGDCHLDMTQTEDFAAALAGALGTVETVATSCEYSVPGGFNSDVNVQYTPGSGGGPQCFARDDSKPCDGGANGWQYAKNADGSDDTSRVVLCGEACSTVQTDPAARIDILVGCDPIVVELF